MIHVQPMELADARAIALWQYPDIYAQYSFTDSPETLIHLLNGTYASVHHDDLGLMGLYCYGYSARIPTHAEGVYPSDALDIGLGLRPDLCGKGLGFGFLRIGMAYGQKIFHPVAYRLSVAQFNRRAVKVYARAGFRTTRLVENYHNHLIYQIMQTPPLISPEDAENAHLSGIETEE